MPLHPIFIQNGSPVLAAPFIALVAVLVTLDIILKGIALWRAARMQKTAWFVVLLILNTAGILPLIFILVTNDEYNRSPLAKLLKRKK